MKTYITGRILIYTLIYFKMSELYPVVLLTAESLYNHSFISSSIAKNTLEEQTDGSSDQNIIVFDSRLPFTHYLFSLQVHKQQLLSVHCRAIAAKTNCQKFMPICPFVFGYNVFSTFFYLVIVIFRMLSKSVVVSDKKEIRVF